MSWKARFKYFFHGELSDAARLLKPKLDASTCRSAILDALSEVVDLERFVPHLYSTASSALVPLDELEDRELDDALNSHELSEICLFPAPRKAVLQKSVDGDILLCDSAQTQLSGSFFGIGIVRGRSAANHGTVWRTALQLGASFTFTVGAPYSRKIEGGADVYKTLRQIPCISYKDEEAMAAGTVVGAEWVAVEAGGQSLREFTHPKRALYILGSELEGLSISLVSKCQHHVSIDVAPGRPVSMNVAAAAAVVLWDRKAKGLA